MIAVVGRLVGHDLRAAPAPSIALAVLLTVAALPVVAQAPTGGAMVVAAMLAVAATSGALAAHERRHATLELNGGGAGTSALISAASMIVPGAAATAVVQAAALASGQGPGMASTAAVCLAVPLVAAGVIPWVGRSRPPARSRRFRRLTWVGWVLAVVAGVLLVPFVAVPLGAPLALAAAGRAIDRNGRIGRTLTALAAVGLAVGVAAVLGQSSIWFDLFIGLALLGPVAAVCVARLGTAGLDATSAVVARLGPRARLAAAPLRVRRRGLGPLVAVLAVVTALTALDGTVGASFGRRQAERRSPFAGVTARAGSSPDQAIAAVRADPAVARLVAADVARRRRVRTVVIDQLGGGGVGRGGFLSPLPDIGLAPGPGASGPAGSVWSNRQTWPFWAGASSRRPWPTGGWPWSTRPTRRRSICTAPGRRSGPVRSRRSGPPGPFVRL